MSAKDDTALILQDAIRQLAKGLQASADVLCKGGKRHAKSGALGAVLEFLRVAGIQESSLLPLWELYSDLERDQEREEYPGKRPPKEIKATADQGHALAVIDLLVRSGLKLNEATQKVAAEVPGLGLSADQLKTLRKHAGRGNQRKEMQAFRRTVIEAARANDWTPAAAAEVMLRLLRERTYTEKKGQ